MLFKIIDAFVLKIFRLRPIFFLVIALFYSISELPAQVSKPIIQNITPKDYEAETFNVSPQNWGIIQHRDGRVFVANTSGVLIWDGIDWEMVNGTEKKRFFKFASDSQGRIYTGGIEDLGYIGADSIGKATFKSLKDRLPEEVRDFSQIFRLASLGDQVFFLGGPHLFVWENEDFTVYQDENQYSRVFSESGRVFVSTKKELKEYVKGELVEISGGEVLGELQLRGVIPVTSGNAKDGLFLATKNKGIFLWSEGELINLNPGLDSLKIFNIAHLRNELVGLGTNEDGLVIVDYEGNVVDIINEESGLINAQVTFPYQEPSGGDIWLAEFSGLSRVEYNKPIEIWDDKSGLTSAISDVFMGKGQIYVGSSSGAFRIPEHSSHKLISIGGNASQIQSGEIWEIFELNDDIWIVDAIGLFRISESGTAEYVLHFPIVVNGWAESSLMANRYYYCDIEHNLGVMVFSEGKWSRTGPLVKLDHYANSILEDDAGRVWVAGQGVSYVEINDSVGDVVNIDSTVGLPVSNSGYEITNFEGEILICCEKGIYRYDPVSQSLLNETRFGSWFSNGGHSAYNLTSTKEGNVWITSDFGTGILFKSENGSYQIDSLVLSGVPIGDIYTIYEDSKEYIWLGSSGILIRVDPAQYEDYKEIYYQQEFYSLIRKIEVNGDSVIFRGTFSDGKGLILSHQPKDLLPVLSYAENHLTFNFSAPFFELPGSLEFSHQLVGQETKWTPWTEKTETEYTNLWEGEYTFRVRARNAYGTISKVAEYRFEILPPWYRTVWAYLFYGLMVVLGVVLIVRLNTRRLLAAKRRLEGIVDERTQEIQRQMKQLAKQKEIISEEKEKSESLLLNILPKSTSEELKEKGTASPMYFEQVSVLFTDFKGFTMISEFLSPKQLVDEIHECFSEFDRITKRHGIEKIKTIGDAYMAAGGLPEPNTTNPVDVVRAALEIRDYMNRYLAERAAIGERGFEIRLGVHTGPVVAGIVGLHKFQYDIWGDAVNTAARMESSGEVAKVNISQATYELVKDEFECTFRGKVKAKNKGEIAMYFVEWKKTPPGADE